MVYMLWYVSGSIHIQSITIWCTEKVDDSKKMFSTLPNGGSLSYLKSLLFFRVQKGLPRTCNCQSS
jgi:hypothetical protein